MVTRVCAEIVTSPYRVGILEQVGNRMTGRVITPNGTRFSGISDGWLDTSGNQF